MDKENQKAYIEKLQEEIKKLEDTISYFQNAFKETYIVAYREGNNLKEIYDQKINITSLDKLTQGWDITFEKVPIPKSNQRIVSFIGNKGKGKTFAFNLLTSQKIMEETGPTEGLGIKTLEGCKTFLDIPGSNSLNFLNESSDEMKQKGLTSKFLEHFLVEMSNILVFVVGRMTVQDIQCLKTLKMNLSNKKIIVLHNMTMITQDKAYNEFNKTLNQYGFPTKKFASDFNVYIEEVPEKEDCCHVFHLLLANHLSKFYQMNLNAIIFIQSIIDSSKAQSQFDLAERLKWFIVDSSWKYYGQQISGEEIEVTNDKISLKREKIVIEPFISYFTTDIVTHKIDPSYHYFYTETSFVVQIELSNKCEDLHSNVMVVNDKYLFQIYGVKKEEKGHEDNDSNVSLVKFGEFLLRITVPINNGLLSDSEPKAQYQNGILYLTYSLLQVTSSNSKLI